MSCSDAIQTANRCRLAALTIERAGVALPELAELDPRDRAVASAALTYGLRLKAELLEAGER